MILHYNSAPINLPNSLKVTQLQVNNTFILTVKPYPFYNYGSLSATDNIAEITYSQCGQKSNSWKPPRPDFYNFYNTR